MSRPSEAEQTLLGRRRRHRYRCCCCCCCRYHWHWLQAAGVARRRRFGGENHAGMGAMPRFWRQQAMGCGMLAVKALQTTIVHFIYMKVVESFTVMHSRQNPHYIYKRISRWAAMYYLENIKKTIEGYGVVQPQLMICSRQRYGYWSARCEHGDALPANDF